MRTTGTVNHDMILELIKRDKAQDIWLERLNSRIDSLHKTQDKVKAEINDVQLLIDKIKQI